MTNYLATPCTAFADSRRIASGALIDVALAIKAAEPDAQGSIITFDDASGAVVDLDLRGSTAEIVSRLTEHGELEALATKMRDGSGDGLTRPRGRPKLGVVAREVTLLPRHWEWLRGQSGGASQALRRLVDEARRADQGQSERKAAHERTYRFLSAIAGDMPGFEEAIRTLFAGETEAFSDRMAAFPPDIRDHALKLARPDPAEGKL